MKEVKQVKIKYRSGIMHKGTINGEPYTEYQYDYVTANLSSVKRFNNAVMLLMGITGCEHHLIEWLSDTMPATGYVSNNEVTRRAFIAFHSRYKKQQNKPYSEHAVIKAFGRLNDDGFLIPVTRGIFMINPMLYFAKNDEDRIKSIKWMMEFKAGIETKMTIQVDKKK